MIRCPECDWEFDDAEEICPNCGAILAEYADGDTGDLEE